MKARRFLICVVAALAFVAATRPAEAQLFRRLWRPRTVVAQSWAYSLRPTGAETEFERKLGPGAARSRLDAEAEARAVEAEINAVRERNGLRPLVFDAELAAGSRSWSAVMARLGECRHAPGATSEICAAWQQTPGETVVDWFNSDGHRAEMLNPYYARVGAGVAVDRWGQRYWTARFR